MGGGVGGRNGVYMVGVYGVEIDMYMRGEDGVYMGVEMGVMWGWS